MDLFPRRAAGAAHRLRRHRRRDPGDQRGRRRPLPAQAVGPAGGEALPGRRRAASTPGRRPATRRCPRSRSSATAGRRRPTRSATSWPATRCPTAGTASDEPEGGGCSTRPGVGPDACPWWSPPDGRALPAPSTAELAGAVGLSTDPGRRLLRPGHRRRRPGRAGRRRLRRLRGAAHACWSSGRPPAGRPGRARGSRTTSGFPDGVSGGQLTDRARRQAAKFGAEMLTARDGDGLEARGPGPGGALRRRRRDRRPRGRAGHRRRLPRAAGAPASTS